MSLISYDQSVITLWRVHVTSLTTSMSTMRFLIENMSILKAITSHFEESYDKLNLTRMKLMKLADGSFHEFHLK